MCNFDIFQSILHNSKQFKFEYGTILVLTHYRTGETIKLDLALLNEDMLEKIIINEDGDIYE